MPFVPPPAKVLVTGANGYIGAWITRLLLEQGYSVQGVVRTQKKGNFLLDYFDRRGFGADKFGIVIVEDIVAEGAFDAIVEDVDAIVHTASPCVTHIVDPQDFIRPALQGTLGVLQSALRHGKKVKRIVLTSSTSAVADLATVPRTFSEKDWYMASIQTVEEKGANANVFVKYAASKTLAEKAAWEFYEQNKTNIEWDLVVLNPSFFFGPPIHEITGGPASLNMSLQYWYDAVLGEGSKSRERLSGSDVEIDVRDAALAHVLALQKEAAGGERILITGST
ncbi:hypothetical protein AN958_00368 [Leucoagaricus sp. SymC.cos]|nr:hypothetical protein AN958_00368 [Leucoagaricus sp. SymC.cos]